MAQIKVKTLTPVHVGSGKELMEGFGYIYFPEEQTVAVIDDKKIVGIIGEDNIDNWTNLLLRNDLLLTYLSQRKRDLKSDDVALRKIKFKSKIPLNRAVIREQINTLNQPYLPGSSIKGAVKTAVYASEIIADNSLFKVDKIRSKTGIGKTRFQDNALLKSIFGKEPNDDYFKLLQISDVLFPETVCLQTQSINTLRNDKFEIKKSISQFVECLPAGAETTGRINIGEHQRKEISKKNYIPQERLNKINLPGLFNTINAHTKDLINEEIGRWEDKNLPGNAASFCEKLEKVLDVANKCEEGKSCVLRLGFGSGFRFMTGDLIDLFSNDDYADFEAFVRKGNRYSDFELPKTRRITENGGPLGFVLLTLQ